ncbi:MAG TPA: DUF3108 domain-containing protein [Chitinophagales bacterium]|nr:DUF3108 domain-containing protein [Chitinophagales bacterium]HMU68669.1 DUF3108 domain-containing protein [Chitinophagales bacterium]HMX04428.1 DUF3108 domain-containing protein [Chitinophagales bacterium]HMZ88280.1 DUF3108 domain-containing protein [Chitinophagales bacterium]HNA57546.1 DUF3108 domain-containing protein [Chitinophagales bacterium]
MIKPLLITALSFSALVPGTNEDFSSGRVVTPSESCEIPHMAFQGGESLTYKVYYNWGTLWLSGGEVYFKLTEESFKGIPVLHASGEAISYKSFDWFFKVRDKADTYMNKQTLQSYKFSRDVYEGGYTFYRSYDWDREKNIIYSYQDNHKGKKETKTIYNADPCGVDLLSTFYWIRTIDYSGLKKGDKVPVKMAIDDAQYDMYVRYDGKEVYETKLGKFNCVKLKPLLQEGKVFKEGEGMTIWVTDDQNRIPVRIESDLRVGRITCDLKSYGGNKFPFTSKVN